MLIGIISIYYINSRFAFIIIQISNSFIFDDMHPFIYLLHT